MYSLATVAWMQLRSSELRSPVLICRDNLGLVQIRAGTTPTTKIPLAAGCCFYIPDVISFSDFYIQLLPLTGNYSFKNSNGSMPFNV